MGGQEVANPFGRVRVAVVDDQVQRQVRRRRTLDLREELAELGGAMATGDPAENLAGRDIEVFLVGTTFAGVDLFAHEATFAGLLPNLARSYGLDAMELDAKTPFKPPKASAQRLVADVVAAQARAYPAVGQGQDVRIESPTVVGGALVEGDAVLHLAAFRRDAEGGPNGSGGYRRASQRRAGRMRRE